MAGPEENLLEELNPGPDSGLAPGEVVIGQLHGLSDKGEALVDFQQNGSDKPIPAMSTLAVNAGHVGRQVALLFTQGELNRPLIIGFIHSPLMEMIDDFELSAADSGQSEAIDAGLEEEHENNLSAKAIVDGKRVVVEGSEEIVLKCGEASITLTKAGKIMIRGKYILNRSTGVNRILGGSVQVN